MRGSYILIMEQMTHKKLFIFVHILYIMFIIRSFVYNLWFLIHVNASFLQFPSTNIPTGMCSWHDAGIFVFVSHRIALSPIRGKQQWELYRSALLSSHHCIPFHPHFDRCAPNAPSGQGCGRNYAPRAVSSWRPELLHQFLPDLFIVKIDIIFKSVIHYKIKKTKFWVTPYVEGRDGIL